MKPFGIIFFVAIILLGCTSLGFYALTIPGGVLFFIGKKHRNRFLSRIFVENMRIERTHTERIGILFVR